MKTLTSTILGIILTLVIGCSSVFAATDPIDSKEPNPRIFTVLTISDPATGDQWEWEIPKNEVKIVFAPTTRNFDGTVECIAVSFNAGKYIYETFANPSISTSKDDNIIISTGLTYAVKGQQVAISNVFGSTQNTGLYYAENRKVYWRNPGSGSGATYSPTINSWNYPTDSKYGLYTAEAPPYSLLDCRIRVSGMTSYRDISVMCQLFL